MSKIGYSSTVLYCTVLYCTVLYSTALSSGLGLQRTYRKENFSTYYIWFESFNYSISELSIFIRARDARMPLFDSYISNDRLWPQLSIASDLNHRRTISQLGLNLRLETATSNVVHRYMSYCALCTHWASNGIIDVFLWFLFLFTYFFFLLLYIFQAFNKSYRSEVEDVRKFLNAMFIYSLSYLVLSFLVTVLMSCHVTWEIEMKLI